MSISCSVITPVGPGHEEIVERCKESVKRAINYSKGKFDEINHIIVEDVKGEMGRSAARNKGMNDSDWYFFLDADDCLMEYAFGLNCFGYDATFGAIQTNGKITKENKQIVDKEIIIKYGAQGTLSMGFFIKSEIAKKLKFNEELNKAEDFEFYCRLLDYKIKKHSKPLVDIDRLTPSATGPRGYEKIDWWKECEAIIEKTIR